MHAKISDAYMSDWVFVGTCFCSDSTLLYTNGSCLHTSNSALQNCSTVARGATDTCSSFRYGIHMAENLWHIFLKSSPWLVYLILFLYNCQLNHGNYVYVTFAIYLFYQCKQKWLHKNDLCVFYWLSFCLGFVYMLTCVPFIFYKSR